MPLMIYCAATLASFSDSISYITYLFSEWCIVRTVRRPSVLSLDVKNRRNSAVDMITYTSMTSDVFFHSSECLELSSFDG